MIRTNKRTFEIRTVKIINDSLNLIRFDRTMYLQVNRSNTIPYNTINRRTTVSNERTQHGQATSGWSYHYNNNTQIEWHAFDIRAEPIICKDRVSRHARLRYE